MWLNDDEAEGASWRWIEPIMLAVSFGHHPDAERWSWVTRRIAITATLSLYSHYGYYNVVVIKGITSNVNTVDPSEISQVGSQVGRTRQVCHAAQNGGVEQELQGVQLKGFSPTPASVTPLEDFSMLSGVAEGRYPGCPTPAREHGHGERERRINLFGSK